MQRLLSRRPSPAMVVALVALFVALGGSAYAGINLPKNSVGTMQLNSGAVTAAKLHSNAVTSGKIQDHSLLAQDFKVGQLPQGPQGAQGPQGIQGPKGDTGAPATKLFAAIGANCGSVDRSSGGVTAYLDAGARCDVTFPQSVKTCVPSITIRGGDSGHGEFMAHTNADQGLQGATFSDDGPNKVIVIYEDSSGAESTTNRPPFFIAVFC